MKISKLFHWLYFTVMMLPIFVIPIYAIYTRNENYSSNISITIEGEPSIIETYNYKQFVVNGKPSSDLSNIGTYDASISFNSNNDSLSVNGDDDLDAYYTLGGDVVEGHTYYLTFSYYTIDSSYADGTLNCFITGSVHDLYEDYFSFGDDDWINVDLTFVSSYDDVFSTINFYTFFTDLGNYQIKDLQLFDLTLTLGVGNESISTFKALFPNDYYDYTLDGILTNVISEGTDSIIYDDTDVGSQFIYTTYNAVDKYFNYDNVFNFGDLYTYLVNTFFNGAVSLGFFIFWHLLIYWLLTSLLWLLFDVLMYVPQLVHRWLDKASLS